MAIEIKELKVTMKVKNSHGSTSGITGIDSVIEQRIIDKSVRKSVDIMKRKLGRFSER